VHRVSFIGHDVKSSPKRLWSGTGEPVVVPPEAWRSFTTESLKDLNLLRFNKLSVHLQSPHNTIYPLTANLLTHPTLRLSKV